MSPPPVPQKYIMLVCGCRGLIPSDLNVQVLTCPNHGTAGTYVVEQHLHLPMRYKLSFLRLLRWYITPPTTNRECVLKILTALGIGAAGSSVLILIVVINFALRG